VPLHAFEDPSKSRASSPRLGASICRRAAAEPRRPRLRRRADETFALALAEFGEQGLVDLIGSLGNFSMLAMLLNTFQVDLQAVEPPFPDVRGYAKVNDKDGAG